MSLVSDEDGLAEIELMPGVFLVGRPHQVAQKRDAAYENGTFPHDIAQSPELLEAEIRRLEISILHLVRSNEELAVVKDDDADFADAMSENVIVLERQRTRMQNLKRALAELSTLATSAPIPIDKQAASAPSPPLAEESNGVFL